MTEQAKTPTPSFSRAFNEVYHLAWVSSDGTNDPVAMMRLASEFSHEHIKSGGAFSVYRKVLSPDLRETVLWVERYPDLKSWAHVETAAQTSPEFFGTIAPIVARGGLTMGLSEIMIDDTLNCIQETRPAAPVVQWTRIRGPLKNMVGALPILADKLQSVLTSEGFKDVVVRFLGMPTSAGPSRNTGHLWIEYPTESVALSSIVFVDSSPALQTWREEFSALIDTVEDRHLLILEAEL